MIECTFQHIMDVGKKGESRLWQSGITSWQNLLQTSEVHPHFTRKLWKRIQQNVIECNGALNNRDWDYFVGVIPEDLYWRLFPNLINEILYFDVEATGLDLKKDTITTIATYNGKEVRVFIQGDNLNEFPEYVSNYSAIATFYGESYDLPILKNELNMTFDQIHFDLYKISRQIGLSGGLKQIETRLGINREGLTGVDGRTAIYLWEEYKKSGNSQFLETLIAYNIEDVIHLEELMYSFYEELRKKDHVPTKKIRSTKREIPRPYKAYETVLTTIQEKYSSKNCS